ncbi:hypothetical protein ABXS75_15930 [Roseburia hominis]
MSRMTEKKAGVMLGLIYLIAFGVANMLIFFIFDEKNTVFWISYGFMCVAFVVQIVSMFLAFKALEAEAVFFGIPLSSLSLFYFFAAVFTAVVFMFFQNAPLKLALALHIIILAVYTVVAILSLMSRDVVQDVNDQVKVSVTAIRSMQVDVDTLMGYVNDAALKKSLRKLSETIRYSDPMSNDAVVEIEDEIMQAISELRILCENEQNAEAMQACRDTELLFVQRNKLLKATK